MVLIRSVQLARKNREAVESQQHEQQHEQKPKQHRRSSLLDGVRSLGRRFSSRSSARKGSTEAQQTYQKAPRGAFLRRLRSLVAADAKEKDDEPVSAMASEAVATLAADRAALVDALDATEVQLEVVKAAEGPLEVAVEEAVEEANGLHEEVLTLIEDLKLLEHRDQWAEAARAVFKLLLGSSEEERVVDLFEFAERALEVLHDGEPELAACSLAAIQTAEGGLHVLAATPLARKAVQRAKRDAVWSDTSQLPVVQEAFSVLRSGEPLLCSRHGKDAKARSTVPLRQRNGDVFGVLVSGSPALPDAYLEAMARAIGMGLECAWRLGQALETCEAAVRWGEAYAMGGGAKLYATWDAQQAAVDPAAFKPISAARRGRLAALEKAEMRSVLKWRPLQHVHEGASSAYAFEGVLRWPGGHPLGVLRAAISDARQAEHTTLLHGLFEFLQKRVAHLAVAAVGSVAAHERSAEALEAGYLTERPAVGPSLSEQLSTRVGKLLEIEQGTSVALAVCVELGTYSQPQPHWVRVMQAACLLTGLGTARTLAREAPDAARWRAVRPLVSSQGLFVKMAALEPGEIRASAWAEAQAVLGTVAVGEVVRAAPKPVALLAAWLTALGVVRTMSLSANEHAAVAGGPC